MLFHLSHTSYCYLEQPVLQDLSLEIQPGESIVFMGSNGCGKTTLLKILSGLLFPCSGSYHYNNREISRNTLSCPEFAKSFHQQVGFVFQNATDQLFCTSVYDEIAFAPRQMGLPETQVEHRVQECLQLLDIAKLRDKVPYHLSGGEKKKVALAATLAMNPQVLLFDEPLNDLDPRTRRFLISFFQAWNQAGKTLILSTHDLDMAAAMAQRTCLLSEDHHLLADGNTTDILQQTELLKQTNLVDIAYQPPAGHEPQQVVPQEPQGAKSL